MNSWRTLYKLMSFQPYHFKSILKSCICPFKQTYLILLEISEVYTKYVLHVQKFFFMNFFTSKGLVTYAAAEEFTKTETTSYSWQCRISCKLFGRMWRHSAKNRNTATESLRSTRFCLTLAGQLTVCQPRPITVDKWSLCNLFEQCAGDHFN